MCTNNNEIDKINDNNDDIMSISTILPVNNPNPCILPDTLDNNNADKNNAKLSNNDKSSDNDSSQGGSLGTQAEIRVDTPEEDPTEGQDQGLRQSRCKNKGTTGKYADYDLMINA
jgi:hypothetical protein